MQFYTNYKEAMITPTWIREETQHMNLKDRDTKDAKL